MEATKGQELRYVIPTPGSFSENEADNSTKLVEALTRQPLTTTRTINNIDLLPLPMSRATVESNYISGIYWNPDSSLMESERGKKSTDKDKSLDASIEENILEGEEPNGIHETESRKKDERALQEEAFLVEKQAFEDKKEALRREEQALEDKKEALRREKQDLEDEKKAFREKEEAFRKNFIQNRGRSDPLPNNSISTNWVTFTGDAVISPDKLNDQESGLLACIANNLYKIFISKPKN